MKVKEVDVIVVEKYSFIFNVGAYPSYLDDIVRICQCKGSIVVTNHFNLQFRAYFSFRVWKDFRLKAPILFL